MPRLSEQLRPQLITELIGQPRASKILHSFLRAPYASCWLFIGPAGTGKTSSALAIARELAVDDCDIIALGCADLTVDRLKKIIPAMRCRPMFSQWRVLLLEELSTLTTLVQAEIKEEFDPINLPRHAIVLATSNDVSKIPEAVLQRFQRIKFLGDENFSAIAQGLLAKRWGFRTDAPLPKAAKGWGWDEKRQNFSMRAMWDEFELELLATGDVEVESTESEESYVCQNAATC